MDIYDSAEDWLSQAHLRYRLDKEGRLEYVRRGIEEARRADDRRGENFLRLGLVGELQNLDRIDQAVEEFKEIRLIAGDRSGFPGYFATVASGLGFHVEALEALRIGFEEPDLSHFSLIDAEEYKVRRLKLVRFSHRVGRDAFVEELKKMARDLFAGIKIPLQDIKVLESDILEILREGSPAFDKMNFERVLLETPV